jgi:predicted outer membrane lipoprotein
MSPWLKAGLIGGAALVVLSLLGLIPCVGCITWILGLLVYAGIGVLAAYWMPPVRMAGPAAGQGAMAAALGALIGGVVTTIIAIIQMALTDTAALLSQIPADTLQQLEQAGIDPGMFMGPGAGAAYGSVCCIAGLIVAALLGAVGGAIFAAIKPD